MLSRLLASSLPLVPRPIVHRVASRYVAGESMADALAAISRLNAMGCSATASLLGEEVRDPAEVEAVVDEYLCLLDELDRRKLRSGVSVKPTHVGLEIDSELCRANLERLVSAAGKKGRFVRIDMEDHRTTDATLEIHRRLRERHSNLGVVVQAYLRRTLDDIRALPESTNVRICKGIYVEPPEIAFQGYEEIRASFLAAVEMLLERQATIAIATHDDYLINRCRAILERDGAPSRKHEFQMLLGVTPGLRRRLVDAGQRMRVYVPYGPDWYDYSLRRLRENPRIAWHVLKALWGRNRER